MEIGGKIVSEQEQVSSEQGVTFVLYTHGRSKLVSQKEWEKSWLDWYNKLNKIQEIE